MTTVMPANNKGTLPCQKHDADTIIDVQLVLKEVAAELTKA
jgi:hypothetical protein